MYVTVVQSRFLRLIGKLFALLTIVLVKFEVQSSVSDSKGEHCFNNLADTADITPSRALVAAFRLVPYGRMKRVVATTSPRSSFVKNPSIPFSG